MKIMFLKTLLSVVFTAILFGCKPQKEESNDKQYKIIG